MGKQSRRKRPSGQPGRLSPELRGAIDELAGPGPVRRAMYEAVGALASEEALAAFAQVGTSGRSGLLASFRDAVKCLADRKPCDLCPAVATRVRFFAVPTGDDFGAVPRPDATHLLAGFSTFCAGCDRLARLDPAAVRRKFLERATAHRAEHGPRAFRRSAVCGPRVGTVSGSLTGCSLQTCEQCGSPMWVAPECRDLYRESDEELCFLCAVCLEGMIAAGRVDVVPLNFCL